MQYLLAFQLKIVNLNLLYYQHPKCGLMPFSSDRLSKIHSLQTFFSRVMYSTNTTPIDIIYYAQCRTVCQDVAYFDFLNFSHVPCIRVKTACIPSKWHSEGGGKHAKTGRKHLPEKRERWEERFIKDRIAGKLTTDTCLARPMKKRNGN